MSDQTIYLDTSAIVKRYIIEEETNRIDKIYDKAHAGKIRLSSSVWSIGETAVVLDKYHGAIKKEFFLASVDLLKWLEFCFRLCFSVSSLVSILSSLLLSGLAR